MTDITAKLADALRAAEALLVNCVPTVSDDRLPEEARGALAKVRAALTAYTASQLTRDDETVERVARALLPKIASLTGGKPDAKYEKLGFYDKAVCDEFARAALSALPARDDALEALREKPGMMLSLTLNVPHGIYTASKTYHAPLWQQYRSEGYPIISTWIDEAGPGQTQDHYDLWTRCIHESQMCEAMVVYREADDVLKGAWLEMGVALGAGVPVFAVGCEDFTIGKSGLLIHCATVDEAMHRARAKLAAPAQRDDGWMPIETAPKDGTRVLAIDQNGAPQILSWRQREPYGKPIGNYGWYLGSFKYFGEQTRFLATHWRPLPAPPAPAQEPRP